MNKQIVFVLLAHLVTYSAFAKPASSTTAITYGDKSSHIAQINKNQLVLVTGTTYSFTVDTPEDYGLVSTQATVEELISEIASTDGSKQYYQLIASNGTAKTTGVIAEGDILQVTAQDGKTTKKYTITFKSMALSGKLTLAQNQITQNTNQSITLSYTAGQRSPNARVQLFLPVGIEPTLNNTSVNVIGRGFVKLSELNNQSIGR
ncbi:hypothetical protein ACHMWN_14535 [Pedobacter sp. UC225_61]|uniref:hypothetical protein n=1 Tax=Pedobacter sp. UC225_61 TaxID=3374623 RepID=UPI00378A0DE9